MLAIQSQRLTYRRLALKDTAFVYALLNDPDWLRYIGDRGINTLQDAKDFILTVQNRERGKQTGLFVSCALDSGEPLGLCSLLKRDFLSTYDVGYSFLPGARGFGYATEAANAIIEASRAQLGLEVMLAIVSKENTRSIDLLSKLDFQFVGSVVSEIGRSELYRKSLI